MNKTKKEAKLPKSKECESILEFLFNESDNGHEELEGYINKYLESQEKWKLVFECIQKIDISSTIEDYFYELMDNIKKILPNIMMSIVIYEKAIGKNKVYSKDFGKRCDYLNKNIFPNLNMYNAHIELSNFSDKFPNNEKSKPNFRFINLEKESLELGYIYLETNDSCEDNDVSYLENITRHIISAIETIGLYESIKKENEEKLKFVASFSHEIKTPLNGIIAYSEMLKKHSDELSDELKNYIENIYISSYQLKCLMSDIIESTKLECGKLKIRDQSFQTSAAIKNVIRIFETQINEKRLHLTPVLIQANIISDYTKFNQILYNLISNAIKFSAPKSTVEATSWVEGNRFYFEIKNYGTGISSLEADKIFKFLQNSDSNAQRNPDGSGIGLSVCKQLVEIQNGSIEFKSSENETVFKFDLPVGNI